MKRHPVYANLVHFYPDPIYAPNDALLVKESDTLILDEANGYKIIAQAHQQFYSYRFDDYLIVPKIEWSNAIIYEHIVGLQAILYHYDQHWYVASKQCPVGSDRIYSVEIDHRKYYYANRPNYDAWNFFSEEYLKMQIEHKLEHNEEGYFPYVYYMNEFNGYDVIETVVSDAFWEIWNERGYETTHFDTSYCYICTIQDNRLTHLLANGRLQDTMLKENKKTPIAHTDYYRNPKSIILHGIRDLNDENAKEISIEVYRDRIDVVQQLHNLWDLNKFPSPRTVRCYADMLNPLICKGFVVVDRKYDRVKVTSPQFLAMKRMIWQSLDNIKLQTKESWRFVLSNPNLDVLQYYPQLAPFLEKYLETFNAMLDDFSNMYADIKHLDIDAFKEAIKPLPASHVFFAYRNRGLEDDVDYSKRRQTFLMAPFKNFLNIIDEYQVYVNAE